MQVRRLSRMAEVTPRRQLQEGGRIGAHGGDREEAGPALDPAGTGSGPERRRQAGSAVPREVAEEGGGFSTEPPANLDPDNDETRPLWFILNRTCWVSLCFHYDRGFGWKNSITRTYASKATANTIEETADSGR